MINNLHPFFFIFLAFMNERNRSTLTQSILSSKLIFIQKRKTYPIPQLYPSCLSKIIHFKAEKVSFAQWFLYLFVRKYYFLFICLCYKLLYHFINYDKSSAPFLLYLLSFHETAKNQYVDPKYSFLILNLHSET